MKRFNTNLISFLLFSAVVLMPFRTSAFVPYGDVNWSTDVNIDDVVRLIDDILTGQTSIADDVDGNLAVNIIDVTTLIDYLLGGELVFDLYNPPVPDSALVITVNGVSFAMMPVKGGSFYPHYSPYVPSTLNDFYMGMTEVTFELWDAVMESRPASALHYEAKPNQPVDCPTWLDCKEFIAKLNELTGLEFHMPTPDQWEYAAMGGEQTHGYLYAGSDDIDEVAWYSGNRPAIYDFYYIRGGYAHTMPVGMKNPNELGLYDMSGNLWEWTESSAPGWGEFYEPYNPEETNHWYAHLRGGSNREAANNSSIKAMKQTSRPNTSGSDFGFRLALQASSLNK